MRNFSTEANVTYVTIKGFRASVRQASHLAELFCKGFGSRSQVASYIARFLAEAENNGREVAAWLTPSELAVINDFIEWYADMEKPCFVYHNLNTGFSLVFLRKVKGF